MKKSAGYREAKKGVRMKTVLIVGNGGRNTKEFLRALASKFDLVVGVDGGIESLYNAKVTINAAIGDFDSLRDKSMLNKLEAAEIITLLEEKDFSDSELAIEYALKKGFASFTFSQMLGGRADHLLFNISLLIRLEKLGKQAKIIEESQEVYVTRTSIKINVQKGDLISLFPAYINVAGVSTKGLKYPLKGKTLRFGSTLPLSNIAIKEKVEISVKRGILLILVEKL